MMIETFKHKQFYLKMEIIARLNPHLFCIDFLLFSSMYELKEISIHEKNFFFFIKYFILLSILLSKR